jgi:hypothetical protein
MKVSRNYLNKPHRIYGISPPFERGWISWGGDKSPVTTAWAKSSTFLKIISCPPPNMSLPLKCPPPKKNNSEAATGPVRDFVYKSFVNFNLPFVRVGCKLLRAICLSKLQYCGTILECCLQENIRFDCNRIVLIMLAPYISGIRCCWLNHSSRNCYSTKFSNQYHLCFSTKVVKGNWVPNP